MSAVLPYVSKFRECHPAWNKHWLDGSGIGASNGCPAGMEILPNRVFSPLNLSQFFASVFFLLFIIFLFWPFHFFLFPYFCSLVYFRRHSSLLAAFPLSCLSFLVFTNSEPKEIVPAFHLTADILPRTLAFFVYFPAETMRLQSVEWWNRPNSPMAKELVKKNKGNVQTDGWLKGWSLLIILLGSI